MQGDIPPPVTVEIDIPITRRQKLHAVVNGRGVQVFHSRRFSEVLTYLLNHHVRTFKLIDFDAEFRLNLRPPLSHNLKPKG